MPHALYRVTFVKLADSSSHPPTRMRGHRVLYRYSKAVSSLQIKKDKNLKKGLT